MPYRVSGGRVVSVPRLIPGRTATDEMHVHAPSSTARLRIERPARGLMASGSRRSYRTSFLLSIGLMAVVVAYFQLDGSHAQETVVALTAVTGALAIWFQMKRAKDMAEGEFIVGLNESFISNDDVKALYTKLINGDPIDRSDQTAIVEYMTFFETIYLLLHRDVVDIRLIDDLFRYRFFVAVTNPDIQALELLPDARFYKNIYTLDHVWTEYRRKVGEAEDSPSSLRAVNPDYLSFVKKG